MNRDAELEYAWETIKKLRAEVAQAQDELARRERDCATLACEIRSLRFALLSRTISDDAVLRYFRALRPCLASPPTEKFP